MIAVLYSNCNKFAVQHTHIMFDVSIEFCAPAKHNLHPYAPFAEHAITFCCINHALTSQSICALSLKLPCTGSRPRRAAISHICNCSKTANCICLVRCTTCSKHCAHELTPRIHSAHSLHAFTPRIHFTNSLHEFNPRIHSTNTFHVSTLCFISRIHSTTSFHDFTPRIHSTNSLHVSLREFLPRVHSINAVYILHRYHNALSIANTALVIADPVRFLSLNLRSLYREYCALVSLTLCPEVQQCRATKEHNLYTGTAMTTTRSCWGTCNGCQWESTNTTLENHWKALNSFTKVATKTHTITAMTQIKNCFGNRNDNAMKIIEYAYKSGQEGAHYNGHHNDLEL